MTVNKEVLPVALRNSENENGYMNIESIRPTPNEGNSSNANSKREPVTMTCNCGYRS